MSIIIRLQNLPWSANSIDIRRYFQGLAIPEGGVHIVGGEKGDAFIAFGSDEDARQAMERDGGKLKDIRIKLLLSSRAEMQRVIEQARTQTFPLQPAVVPVQTPAPVATMNAVPAAPISATTVVNKPTAKEPDTRSDHSITPERSRSPDRRRDRERSPRERDRDRSRDRDRDRDRSRKSSRKDRSRSRSPRRSRDRDRDRERDVDKRSERSRRDDSRRSSDSTARKSDEDSRIVRGRDQDQPRYPVGLQAPNGSMISTFPKRPDEPISVPLAPPLSLPPVQQSKQMVAPTVPPASGVTLPPAFAGIRNQGDLHYQQRDFNAPQSTTNHWEQPNFQVPEKRHILDSDINERQSLLDPPSARPMGSNSYGGGMYDRHVRNEYSEELPHQAAMPRGHHPLQHQGSESLDRRDYHYPVTDHVMERTRPEPGPPFAGPRDARNEYNGEYLEPAPQSVRSVDPPLRGYNDDRSLHPGERGLHPGDRSLLPGDRSLLPGDRNLLPGDRSLLPGDRSLLPGDRSLLPGDRSLLPGDRSLLPGDRSLLPGDRSLLPGDRGLHPGDRSLHPGDRGLHPGDRGLHPGDRGLHPGDRGLHPGDRGLHPGDRGLHPGDRSLHPGDRSLHPGDRGVHLLDRSIHQPDRNLQVDRNIHPAERSHHPGDRRLPPHMVDRDRRHPPPDMDYDHPIGSSTGSSRAPPGGVEIRGLPYGVSYREIKEFLHGVYIPPYSIKFEVDEHGKRTGVAHIRLNSDRDLQEALRRQSVPFMGNTYLEILPCSKDLFEQTDSYGPPSHHRKPPGHQQSGSSGFMGSSAYSRMVPKPEDLCVMMRGLPYQCREEDIVNFFDGLGVLDILIEYDQSGRAIGTGFVEFITPADFHSAMEMNCGTIGHRYIELSVASKEMMVAAREGSMHSGAPPEREHKRDSHAPRELLPHPPNQPDVRTPQPYCTSLQGLPAAVTDRDITEFFSEVEVIPRAIHIMLGPEGMPSGEAFAEFSSLIEFEKALKRHGHELGSKILTVIPVPYQEMVTILGGPSSRPEPLLDRPLIGNRSGRPEPQDKSEGRYLMETPPSGRGRGRPVADPDERTMGRHPPEMMGGNDRPTIDSPDISLIGRSNVSKEPSDRGLGRMPQPGENGPRPPLEGGEPRRGPPHPRPPAIRGSAPPYGPPLHSGNISDRPRGPAPISGGGIRPETFGKPGCVVGISNLPYKAGVADILHFFKDFKLTDKSVLRRYNQFGLTTGDARVAFPTPEDAQKAVADLNSKPIFERSITLQLI